MFPFGNLRENHRVLGLPGIPFSKDEPTDSVAFCLIIRQKLTSHLSHQQPLEIIRIDSEGCC
jgi:hypothetical protein